MLITSHHNPKNYSEEFYEMMLEMMLETNAYGKTFKGENLHDFLLNCKPFSTNYGSFPANNHFPL